MTITEPTGNALRLIGSGSFGEFAQINFGDGNAVYFREDLNDNLEIHSLQRMALTGGAVAIGSAGLPSHRLTITETGSANALRLIGPGVNFGEGARLNFGEGDHAYLHEDQDDTLTIYARTRTALTGGFVGIGTLFPAWPLHVVSAGQAVGRFDSNASIFGSAIELRNNTASSIDLGAINFVSSAGQIRGQLAYKGTADALTLMAGGAERMRIGNTGLIGIGTSSPAFPVDVRGSSSFAALYAEHTHSSANVAGVEGVTNSSSGYGVFSCGDFAATGAKFFVQPHPTDPSKEIHFAALEGNESGTYFRGKVRLVNRRAEIPVPEDFRLVTEPDGLTVQLTALGPARMWLESYDLDFVAIAGEADTEVHY